MPTLETALSLTGAYPPFPTTPTTTTTTTTHTHTHTHTQAAHTSRHLVKHASLALTYHSTPTTNPLPPPTHADTRIHV